MQHEGVRRGGSQYFIFIVPIYGLHHIEEPDRKEEKGKEQISRYFGCPHEMALPDKATYCWMLSLVSPRGEGKTVVLYHVGIVQVSYTPGGVMILPVFKPLSFRRGADLAVPVKNQNISTWNARNKKSIFSLGILTHF